MPCALGNGKAQVSNTFVTLSALRALKTEELLLAVKESRRLNSYELSCNSLSVYQLNLLAAGQTAQHLQNKQKRICFSMLSFSLQTPPSYLSTYGLLA